MVESRLRELCAVHGRFPNRFFQELHTSVVVDLEGEKRAMPVRARQFGRLVKRWCPVAIGVVRTQTLEGSGPVAKGRKGRT